jgi:hypothetical protein
MAGEDRRAFDTGRVQHRDGILHDRLKRPPIARRAMLRAPIPPRVHDHQPARPRQPAQETGHQRLIPVQLHIGREGGEVATACFSRFASRGGEI